MAWRSVMISNPAELSLLQGQLAVRQDGRTVTVPIEDIDTLVLDSSHTQISGQTLSALAEQQTAVFICDEKHTPSAVILPFNSYHRQLKVLKRQMDLGKALQKQLWQQLVRAKLNNQAAVLADYAENGAARLLENMARKVRSGDAGNLEAQAAAAYFRALFGVKFARRKESWQNAALNYAYALLRGLLARSLCAAGYQPALGIGHHSELNAFNLADDLLEPWRPLCDRWVLTLRAETEIDADGQLSPAHKQYLVRQLGGEALLQKERFAISAAVNEQIASLGRAITSTKAERLKHPQWAPSLDNDDGP